MAPEYKIHFLSPDGALLAVVTDYQSFHLVREVNSLGDLTITLRGDHPALASLTHKSLVEVWRRDRAHGLAWTCEARYLYLYYSHSTKEITQVTIKCLDPIWWLSTRIVAWDINISGRTLFFQAAGLTINQLVKYNATVYATMAAGRIREGNIAHVTLVENSAGYVSIGWECPYENLLSTIQRLAPLGPGDFYMEYSGSGIWQFNWMQDQLGDDRSASLTFSIELDNMVDPVYLLDRRNEKTKAIVGGKTVRGDRAYYMRGSADWSMTNDNEMWVPAPWVYDAESMYSAADSALMFVKKIDKLSFNLVQTPTYFYGIDYFLGDKINTIYNDVTRVLEIKKVVIDVLPTGETSLVVSCG